MRTESFRLKREGRTGHTGTADFRGRWGASDRKTRRKDG